MAPEVLHDDTVQADGDVGPAHAGALLPVQLVLLPVGHILEIGHAGVIVVLAREHDLSKVGGVDIGQTMLVGVPTAKAHIQPTHEGGPAVDHTQFLVVRPVENDVVVHTVDALEGIA